MRRLAIVLLLIVAAAVLVYFATSNAPRERNRVEHPAGYSIVAPSGWGARMIVNPDETYRDQIVLTPNEWTGLAPMMWVRRYPGTPDLQALLQRGFIHKQFNGLDALVHQEKPKKYTVREAIFEDHGSWYDIGVSLPGFEALKMDDWWEFALTFRPATTAMTTSP